MDYNYIIKYLIRKWHLIIGFAILTILIVLFSTLNQPKIYRSSAKIYTGFGSGYTIESEEGSSQDYYSTKVKFDNFITIIQSRETIEEVAKELLLIHYKTGFKDKYHYKKQDELIPQEMKEILDSIQPSINDTFHIVNNSKLYASFIKSFNSLHHYYSFSSLSELKVQRILSSDLIELQFESVNPEVCKLVLDLFLKIIIKKYRNLQESQTSTVVNYFEERVAYSLKKLKTAENNLLKFMREKNIINYNEQTKYIASQKEQLDKNYQDELMRLAASKAVIESLEKKLQQKESIHLQSHEILEKRKQLSSLSSEIALHQLYNENYPDKLEYLIQESDSLKKELKIAVQKLFILENTSEGVSAKDVLNDWLQNAIIVSESEARLEVLNLRKQEFINKYKTYAPIGSQLTQIEREIQIIEKEYLNFLHSLNLSKLKQQNLEVASTIKIIDKPFSPLKPKKSRRKLILMLCFMASVTLAIILLVLKEYFDDTIKTPERASELTGFPLFIEIPFIESGNKNIPQTDKIKHYVSDRIIQKSVNNKTSAPSNKKTIIICLLSLRNEEGKSFVGDLIYENLNPNKKTLYLQPQKNNNQKRTPHKMSFYPTDILFLKESYKYAENQLTHFSSFQFLEYDFVIWELPPLHIVEPPNFILKYSNLNLLICDSKRKWLKNDKSLLLSLPQTEYIKPCLVCNKIIPVLYSYPF